MPIGSLVGTLVIATLVTLTVFAPRRPRFLANLSYKVAAGYNEAPFPFIYLMMWQTIDSLLGNDLDSPGEWVMPALDSAIIAGLLLIAWRGAQERPFVEQALREGLGADWPESTQPGLLRGLRTKPPLHRILLMPFVVRPAAVSRVANLPYGEAGGRNLLDVYHHRDLPEGAPVLIHFHGGGYHGGRKSFESRALLFRLARRGWVTIAANYRLRPSAGLFEHLADAKRVIAWVRENGHLYGADPSTLVLAGGSAGGHLSSIAAMTQNDPRYQPGFEDADTSVDAVASLSGWYDGYYELGGPSSDLGVLGLSPEGAPPFFIAHGAKDTLATIESARRFAAHLRSGSSNPVVFAELPHGQHSFDLFHSFRFSAVVDGIEAFTAWIRSSHTRSYGT